LYRADCVTPLESRCERTADEHRFPGRDTAEASVKRGFPTTRGIYRAKEVLITDSHGAAINNHRENKRELIGNGRAIAIEKKAAARLLPARSRANTRANTRAPSHMHTAAIISSAGCSGCIVRGSDDCFAQIAGTYLNEERTGGGARKDMARGARVAVHTGCPAGRMRFFARI